jgi:hypothetical protein
LPAPNNGHKQPTVASTGAVRALDARIGFVVPFRKEHSMKKTMVCLMFMLCVPIAQGADKKEGDQANIEAQFAAFATPGEQHKQMAKMEGSYTTTNTVFFPDPDNPQSTKGEATFKMIMGGRYLRQDFKGEFGGEKFEGMGLTAYDNAKMKYVGTWVDNMGTGIMVTEGTYDEKTGEMTETGVSSSPAGDMKMRMVSKQVNDNEMHFTMYMAFPGGEEQKHMEIVYKRK